MEFNSSVEKCLYFFFYRHSQNNKTKMGLHLEGVHFGTISPEPILILPYDEHEKLVPSVLLISKSWSI